MKLKMTPIVSWSVWAGGLSLVMGLVTRKHLLTGFTTDGTGMSVVITALFIAGLVVSFLAAKKLHSEYEVLAGISRSGAIPKSSDQADLASVFQKLKSYKEKGETVDIHTAIDTYHSKHNSRVRLVSIMAALVISMGLLGTVIGLIMSISGLGGMVENIGLSRTTMLDALRGTVAGMGTAFYTTFFGAMAGLILRAVAVSQLNSLSELCASAAEYADQHLAVKVENKEQELNESVSAIIENFKAMETEIQHITVRLVDSFESTMTSFGQALSEAGAHAMDATKECVSGMTDQMDAYGSEMGSAFGSFNESIIKAGDGAHEAMANVNDSIAKAGDELQGTFAGLNEVICEAGQGVDSAFEALDDSVKAAGGTVAGSLADFQLAVDGTSADLNDAVGELRISIAEATGEMVTMNRAKFDAEAREVAGHLSLAASSIQQFIADKAPAANDETQKVA